MESLIWIVMGLEDVHKACDKCNCREDITLEDSTRDVQSFRTLLTAVGFSYSDTIALALTVKERMSHSVKCGTVVDECDVSSFLIP